MRFQVALLSMLALAAGCNRGAATVSTVPVTGKITIGGKPLEGASVLFSNKNPDAPTASGTTDSQGEFKLSTWVSPKEMHSGAVTGEYLVMITKDPPGEKREDSSKMEHMTPEQRSEFMMQQMVKAKDAAASPVKVKSEVPEIYSQRSTTPLKPTVSIGADNRFEWSLEE